MADQISIEKNNNPIASATEYSSVNVSLSILEVANIDSITEYPNGISDITQLENPYIDIDRYDSTSISTTDILPFRVAFENIWITGYGPGHPYPIGIAVIGFSNYIL